MARKLAFAVLLLLAAAGIWVGAAHLTGGAVPTFGLPVGGDDQELRDKTTSFLEDLQFKDYDHAATYNDPATRGQLDIRLIVHRLFVVKPEAQDIMSYEVVFVDVDSTGLRARVKSRVKLKGLVDQRIVEREVMVFYQRATMSSPWYMRLEDSLRRPDAASDKRP